MSAKKTPLRPSPAAQARATQQRVLRQDTLALLSKLDCLQGVPTNELSRLVEHCTFRAFTSGCTVISRAQPSHSLFLVLQGTLQLQFRDKDGSDVLMAVLGPGDCCGESPLFGDFFRRLIAETTSNCYLFQISLSILRELLPTAPILTKALQRIYKRRMLDCTLARVPLLGQLYPMERSHLADLFIRQHIARGETIIRQGEPADALYLIESGHVAIEQDERVIATLDEGNFFGEMSLLLRRPHGASVRALTSTDVLVLSVNDFYELIDTRPDLESQLREIIEARLQNSLAMQDNELRSRELVLAVERGLLRGSHVLVRTPSLCPPECRLCETACSERHGRPRLQLNGTLIADFDVPNTCRQCAAGAECVEACPEDAFVRDVEGAWTISNACTGCGACVTACPYDAVVQVPLPAQRRIGGPLGQLLNHARRVVRHETIALEPLRPTQRADKCDLCAAYEDHACVARCPTGSLRLVPIDTIFPAYV